MMKHRCAHGHKMVSCTGWSCRSAYLSGACYHSVGDEVQKKNNLLMQLHVCLLDRRLQDAEEEVRELLERAGKTERQDMEQRLAALTQRMKGWDGLLKGVMQVRVI